MKKVLILLKHLSLGGAEKMFLRLINSINIDDYDIHIVLVFNERLQELPLLSNIRISSIFNHKNDEAKFLIKHFPEKVYADNIVKLYDIEIAFLEGYPTRLISASPNQKSLKIAFIHTDFRFFHHSLNAFPDHQCEINDYKKYTKIFCVSKTTRTGLHTVYPELTNKECPVYYPPLNDAMLPMNNEQQDTTVEKPYFITLTRLATEKGLLKLLDSCQKIKEFGFNICFKIYGTGPLHDYLLEKIQADHLEEFVFLMGYNPVPYKALKNSLAYICPSDSESFCIAIEEALFLSTPVIACRSSGTEEILKEGDFGLLVDNSVDGLVNGIYEFLTNPQLQEQLAQKSNNGKTHWQTVFQSVNEF